MLHPATSRFPSEPLCALSDLRAHFIGAGGCGMSGLAKVLLRSGARVTGSDALPSEVLGALELAGATIHVGHSASQLPGDSNLVVISAAIAADNPEWVAARARGVRVLKYAQLLGEVMRSTIGVAVAGTHGKTTTSALTAFLLKQAGLDPSYVIGADVPQLGGGSGAGKSALFVAEACEYDSSFLNLEPMCSVVLNVEEDHLDYFENLEQILGDFCQFISQTADGGIVLFNGDDPNTRQVVEICAGSERKVSEGRRTFESFGLQGSSNWTARNLDVEFGLSVFDLYYNDVCLGRTKLGIPGRHNVHNALAASAVAYHCGVQAADIVGILPEFRGAARRLTHRGEWRGVEILDDYAHHPTEIQASLEAIRSRYGQGRLRVIFQPHQLSRTRFFLMDFARSFTLADEVIVPDIYFVRDSNADRYLITSRHLVEQIKLQGQDARYIANLKDIAEYLASTARAGDLVVSMGAGDVWKVTDEMVRRA